MARSTAPDTLKRIGGAICRRVAIAPRTVRCPFPRLSRPQTSFPKPPSDEARRDEWNPLGVPKDPRLQGLQELRHLLEQGGFSVSFQLHLGLFHPLLQTALMLVRCEDCHHRILVTSGHCASVAAHLRQ